jgi:hypothetical protein
MSIAACALADVPPLAELGDSTQSRSPWLADWKPMKAVCAGQHERHRHVQVWQVWQAQVHVLSNANTVCRRTNDDVCPMSCLQSQVEILLGFPPIFRCLSSVH